MGTVKLNTKGIVHKHIVDDKVIFNEGMGYQFATTVHVYRD